ncbi:MAG: GerW family sporulation protein [Eubacterium sp.]|nr:GerW family sporulation protein [Eubacterium sp.]
MADKNKRATDDLLEAMEHFITTKSVVGQPIKVGDTIILPMADVSFGMGVGTFTKGDNGTGGVGGKITPSAVLVIKGGTSKLISIKDQDGVSKILDMVPDIVNIVSEMTGANKDDKEEKEEIFEEEA